MFAGIDIASERRWLARLDNAGKPITEDRDGYDKLLQALGPAPRAGRPGSDRIRLGEPVRASSRRP